MQEPADRNAGHQSLLDLVFFIGFALLVCHELDAVAQAEWRLLPILEHLPDDQAFRAFVALHVPLFAILFWLTGHRSTLIRLRSQLAVDAFMVIHVGLHALFVDHEHYAFHSVLSESLIYGAGLFGLLHLTLSTWRARKLG
jgi:hypothetical protein